MTSRAPGSAPPLLEVRDLAVTLGRGALRPVDRVDLELPAGGTHGLVGESGCGKSLTALAIMGLLPAGAELTAAAIRLDGTDLSKAELARIRGDRMAMIFQEPMAALNPSMTIGEQIAEALRTHRRLGRRAAWARAVELLREVGIPAPELRVADFPHRLSGGMRQRAMIAIALACRPRLLIADEPTTALDSTVQAQILALLGRLRAETGAAVLLITHDLAVVAETCDRVSVMYAGRIVESGPVGQVFASPEHPYTVGLLGARPRKGDGRGRLAVIGGSVPRPGEAGRGCRFAPRCPFAIDRCRGEAPPLAAVGRDHLAACWRSPLDRAA
jgi:peptide/nickel transport system ATP-binding protein